MEKYDVIIIGAGPAGCTAAIYTGRSELSTLIIEKLSAGGQMATTSEIENYPGFPKGVDGAALAFDMLEQATKFGAKLLNEEVVSIENIGDEKIISLATGVQYTAPCLILAMGAAPKTLGVKGEDEYRGRGVSYCATCDGAFFRNKTVAVIGGGDTAAADALFLSKICKKIYIVHRRNELRAAKVYHKKLTESDNVEFIWDSGLKEIIGENKVIAIIVENLKTNMKTEIDVDGVFIAVGAKPETAILKNVVELNGRGYVAAGESTETSVPGVFVVGDIRTKPLRQIVTAVSDGAVAAYMCEEILSKKD